MADVASLVAAPAAPPKLLPAEEVARYMREAPLTVVGIWRSFRAFDLDPRVAGGPPTLGIALGIGTGADESSGIEVEAFGDRASSVLAQLYAARPRELPEGQMQPLLLKIECNLKLQLGTKGGSFNKARIASLAIIGELEGGETQGAAVNEEALAAFGGKQPARTAVGNTDSPQGLMEDPT